MPTLKIYSLALLSALALTVISSCKDDDPSVDYNSDKTALQAFTDSVQLVYNSSVAGRETGQYPAEAKEELKEAMDLAGSVISGAFTQEEVNNAEASLRRALFLFKEQIFTEISPESLIAYWKFNGNAADSSGNAHNGSLMGSSASPIPAADRFGTAGQAYRFTEGAYIEIPYTASLNPTAFTISSWIYPEESFANNYIISLNRWNGFKVQLQDANYIFSTISTSTGIYDRASDPLAVNLNKWTHIAVSYQSGALRFYINGDLVKTENISGQVLKLESPVNLVIGQELPSSSAEFTAANSFHGSIDDTRLYGTALSNSEILSLYNREKP